MISEQSGIQANNLQDQKLSLLKKQVSLSKSQLLELAYDDQKFLAKLQQLNSLGYEAINEQNYNEAIIYLSEAENILEYAASCGKTIERSLIIATLQNEACVYHRVWELQKSINYIQAIIYNISSFLESEKGIDLRVLSLQENSEDYIKTSIYLKNKLHLVFYYLQFCAVSSQNQSHQNALAAASKALLLMKQICEEEYNMERVARKNGFLGSLDEENHQFLLQLQNIKDSLDENNNEPIQKTIERFLLKAKKTHMKFKAKTSQSKHRNSKIQKELENYSIGYVMQINPVKVQRQPQLLNLKDELQYINKIYKAIYISICHFTMAAELRLLSAEKFPVDPQMKKSSFEFQTSQLHHLISIITAGLYIPCETVYFEHILNSFKNHYAIDLTQKDSQISLTSETWNEQDDDLIHLETSSLNLKKDTTHSFDSQQFLSNTKLKTSVRNSEHNISLGSPELYVKIKKGLSKNKIPSTKDSQKSIKSSSHDHNFNTPLAFCGERNSKSKSKSKNKSMKKSKLKDSSKSRKKSRKMEDRVKSPSIHTKAELDIKKKQSDVRDKKTSDVRKTSRSKTKSRRKPVVSRHELQDSKQKIKTAKSYNNLIQTVSSSKKLPPTAHPPVKAEKQKPKQKQKSQKEDGQIGKMLSNRVYIQRSNNLHVVGEKDKKVLKKESSGINSGSSTNLNADNMGLKFVALKKNKSPSSNATTAGTVTEKQSRSSRKNIK